MLNKGGLLRNREIIIFVFWGDGIDQDTIMEWELSWGGFIKLFY